MNRLGLLSACACLLCGGAPARGQGCEGSAVIEHGFLGCHSFTVSTDQFHSIYLDWTNPADEVTFTRDDSSDFDQWACVLGLQSLHVWSNPQNVTLCDIGGPDHGRIEAVTISGSYTPLDPIPPSCWATTYEVAGSVWMVIAVPDPLCGVTNCDINNGFDCNDNLILDSCETPDCNGNSFPDECDIAAGAPDCDRDGIPDDCEGGSADVNGDGVVGFSDLTEILIHWGTCPGQPSACPWDVNNDAVVGFADLTLVLLQWGPCSPPP